MVDESQVVFGFEPWAGGDDLGEGPLVDAGAEVFFDVGGDFFEEEFFGFCVPVRDEDGVELVDDGAGAEEGEVLPVEAFFDVAAQVVAAVDGVLGAGEGVEAVDDEDFAVVAEVGALPLEAPGFEGEHEPPGHSGLVEFVLEFAPAGVFAGADVVDEDVDGDAALVGADEGVPEGFGGGVEGGDVELEVDVLGGLVDAVGHFLDGRVVVAVEGEAVAADEGEGPELVVEVGGDAGGF